ncbi:MAG: hypothetical protein KAU03_01405 [Candidatus Altiarchaeales archaeon]|nr:hypothetical protein [Candidatus Altiarchaeales archaeon]
MKIDRLDRERIDYYLEEYNGDPDNDEDIRIEREVGERIRKNMKLSPSDLEEVIQWKYITKGARGNLKRAREIPDGVVELITETALKIKNDEYRVNVLKTLRGVGVGTASAILAFYDPENYGVGDTYIMDAFFSKEKTPTTREYLDILKILREEKERHGLGARDIEKAYYQVYYEKYKKNG